MRGIPKDYLFSHAEWFPVAENRKTKMLEEIRNLPENQVLNTSIDDLCDYLVSKYSMDVPVLDESGIQLASYDTQVDRADIFGDRFVGSGTRCVPASKMRPDRYRLAIFVWQWKRVELAMSSKPIVGR
jgi:hypothetical protein